MDWFGEDSSETFKHSSFEEFLKNEKGLYYQIINKIGKQFDLDGIWSNDSYYYTSFNGGTIVLMVKGVPIKSKQSSFRLEWIDYKNN